MRKTNILFFSVILQITVLLLFLFAFNGNLENAMTYPNHKEKRMNHRYEIGLKNLKAIDGEAGERVIESLRDVSPDLARYTIEYPFGDIYNRPGLDLKSREIATIAALVTMGNAAAQLKVHINAGLNVGLSKKEIEEIIIQMSVYAGFPAALNGMYVAKEVFSARK